MLGIQIIAVGKLKEAYLREAAAEYRKRMAAFFQFEIIEVDEAKLPQNPSPAQITQAMEKEGEAILAKLPPRTKIIALCIEGETMPAERLAEQLGRAAAEFPRAAFLIGGSHGLSQKVKEAAHLRLSLSPMTFPHQLARIMRVAALPAGSI
jgi:23S rRNA (pseudouridine1915-N3)-methyltransferase